MSNPAPRPEEAKKPSSGSGETATNNNNNNSNDYRHPDEWMTKNCDFYKEEYKDCKSFKARFNQHFIFGERQDCKPWNEDHGNCLNWKKFKDKDALEALIASEKKRLRTRLLNHYKNDVWENRESPPEDWNKELPPEITRHYKNSYLAVVREEYHNSTKKTPLDRLNVIDNEDQASSCSIM